MPKNEDGEFELILGNRQLLSVFFIVVVLLGVFFTMGYIVGRNSGPLGAPEVVAARKETKPLVVDSPVPRESAPTPTPAREAPTETAPQRPTPEPTKAAEPAKLEPPPKRERPKLPPVPATATNDQPSSGQLYLQLAATSQHEAEIEVDVLRKKGFRAITAEIPERHGTFRVLVGPLPEGSANKTKADLTAAGFPGDRAIRRTF
jgi:cell division septation protein DedD